jgi:amidase
VQNEVRRATGRFMADYDLLLTPTLSILPQPIGRYSQNVADLDFDAFFRRCDEIGSHLPLSNVTGQPAISLPLFQSRSGVPIGIQFAARFGAEATLIRVASAFEEALPWRGRKPAVHVR